MTKLTRRRRALMAKSEDSIISLKAGTYISNHYTTVVDSTGMATLTVDVNDTYSVSRAYFTKNLEIKSGDVLTWYMRGKSGTGNVLWGFLDVQLNSNYTIKPNDSNFKYNTKYTYTATSDMNVTYFQFCRRTSGTAPALPYTTNWYIEIYVNGVLKVGRE